MRRTVWTAENASRRSLSIDNVSVSATRGSLLQSEYDVIVCRLEWASFAASTGTSSGPGRHRPVLQEEPGVADDRLAGRL